LNSPTFAKPSRIFIQTNEYPEQFGPQSGITRRRNCAVYGCNSESVSHRAPLLIREVFHIHVIFISITLSIFALLTWRFVHEIASATNPLAIWLATAIGMFWIVRSVMQWLHYSSSHWRGNMARTLIHWTLFLGYGAMAVVYLAAAFWRNA
jgi:hypothetical protein